jgi:hypothetical protein
MGYGDKFGIALHDMFGMLCNTVPNSMGDPLYGKPGASICFIASVYMVMVHVCTFFHHRNSGPREYTTISYSLPSSPQSMWRSEAFWTS